MSKPRSKAKDMWIISIGLVLCIFGIWYMCTYNQGFRSWLMDSPEKSLKDKTSSIVGEQWSWKETRFLNGSKIEAPDGDKFVLIFQADERFTSTSDCNSLFGNFILNGEILSIGPIASTQMFCSESALESQYSQELSRATSYMLQGNQLQVNLVKDSGTMIFEKKK